MAADTIRKRAPGAAGIVAGCGAGLVIALTPVLTAIVVLGSLLLASVLAVALWGAACEAAARGDDLPGEQPDIADTLTGLNVRVGHLIAR